MTKSRKKKNNKLRRRVMRTMASIIMIMAIVVAAIPVENYGTMKAANEDDDISLHYAEDEQSFSYKYNEDEQEGQYTGDRVTIQRIVDGAFMNVFEAAKASANASGAVINNNLLSDSVSDFDIQNEEYYNYVFFDDDFINELNSQFSAEVYEITFGDSTTTSYAEISSSSYQIVDDSEQGSSSGTEKLNAILLKKLNSNDQKPTKLKVTKPTFNSLTAVYKVYNAPRDYTALKVYEECEPQMWGQKLSDISTYNDTIDGYISELETIKNKIDNSEPLTSTEVARWNEISKMAATDGEIGRQYTEAQKISNTYSSLSTDNDSDGLSNVAEYILCNCFDKSASDRLNRYDMTPVIDLGGKTVYIPKLLNGMERYSSQIVDNNGYLVGGSVRIEGIASEAFQASRIRNISIPSGVKFIGEKAFYNSDLLVGVTIDDQNCTIIGDEAFADCNQLSTVSFTNEASRLETVGVKAFANSSLREITLPNTVTTIGAGCFVDSDLQSLNFYSGGGLNTEIEPYAFYNCVNLNSVTFPNDKVFEIAKGAFALGADKGGGTLTEFVFPYSNDKIDYGSESLGYDYILAGRSGLATVTWPALLSSSIPDNTLKGCANLEYVRFPETARYAEYSPDKLFLSVMYSEFYVEGPRDGATVGNSIAKPRSITWDAVAGYDDGQGVVPYMYTDEDGSVHFEIGVGDTENGGKKSDYIATIDVIDGTNEAVLSKYAENGTVSDDHISVTIPATVGNYNIIEIGENCFADNVKNKIYELIIEDASIRRISASAFQGASALQWVEIGDAVEFIGSEAFADCEKLENVVFSQTKTALYGDEDTYWSELVIEDHAFDTNSDYLTFHGAINPNYAPFQLAMSENNIDMTGSECQVCYKTDAPLNLTVIRDRDTGKATLIDYPHYEEIDTINSELVATLAELYKDVLGTDVKYSITDKFEEINGVKNTSTYSAIGTMDTVENNVVLQTLNLQIPKGIESIDSKAYFNNSNNASDFAYFSLDYKESAHAYQRVELERNINKTVNGETDVRKLYSTYEGISVSEDENTIAGLFSGFFNESAKVQTAVALTDQETSTEKGLMWQTYSSHYYTENNDRGNDYLTNVYLESVESIPDYGFDSAENLKTLTFNDSVQSVGVLPFRDCKSLYNIDTQNNNIYSFENMLFYENQGDDTNISNQIIQCLEGRGSNAQDGNYGSTAIDSTSNPLLSTVTSIADYAFSNCTDIVSVDLSASSIKLIPEGTFDECVMLREVILPSTVNQIDQYAFRAVSENGNFRIDIPNPYCVISDKAFDFDRTTHVYIRGVQYIDERTQEESPCYTSYLQLKKLYGDQIDFVALGSTYTVDFVDHELNLIESFEVETGATISNPPTAPARNGYDFDRWICRVGDDVLTGFETYTNITEDRTIIATYIQNPKTVVSDGYDYTFEFENCKAFVNGTEITTGASYPGGTTINLIADESTFAYWSAVGTAEDNAQSYDNLFDGTGYVVNFTMPNADVKVTANLTGSGSGNGGSDDGNSGDDDSGSGGNGSGDSSTDSGTKYTVTVNYGSGSGEYSAGDTVSISAYAPESSSRVFSRWTSNSANVGFVSATSATTTFIMPAADVTVTANYKTRTDDDDDDDSSSSRRPGTSTSTTTVTNRPGNSTTTTGTTGTVTNTAGGSTGGSSNTGSDGSRIYITKNGVSNKDVASVSVEGSTDNFIVRITESAEATAAVEEALINRYGSLDGLVYFPMDISLYDATGQNKITDTYGLNITVTMPIPDVLIQYGGNARVAAADNGNLQQLTPRFTTIDGIACISFVPPHFSPYVIYVDTNNLIAGQTLDSTPSTGDPIHPKWFAAIGMACISIILFATSDGRKRRDYKTA